MISKLPNTFIAPQDTSSFPLHRFTSPSLPRYLSSRQKIDVTFKRHSALRSCGVYPTIHQTRGNGSMLLGEYGRLIWQVLKLPHLSN